MSLDSPRSPLSIKSFVLRIFHAMLSCYTAVVFDLGKDG